MNQVHTPRELVRIGDQLARAVGDLRRRHLRRRLGVGVGTLALVPATAALAHATIPWPSRPRDRPAAVATQPDPSRPTPTHESTTSTTPKPTPPPEGEVPDPDAPLVLVDHHRYLPPGWEPAQLVPAPIPFAFDGDSPKRLLRPVAAEALGELVDAARSDGISILGVSGYRSEATQRSLFERYAAQKGEEAASKVSARPSHSEHQTGLAMDVTGADGACQATACFADSPEAAWLADHAFEHGWVVRYPPGAEDITGYEAEAWHLRYVGPAVAAELHDRNLTLDQYLGAA